MTVIGTCRFCGRKDVELKNSHIFSEFLYKPTYDEKSRALNISPKPSERDVLLQKGIRERLFCLRCEQQLNNYETHAARIIQNLPSMHRNRPGNTIYVPEVDYQKFKLFQISLLWRASITSRREFSEVSLGRHEEQLRLMLASDSPGEPWEYGCILMGFSGEEELDGFIKLPNRHRFEGHIAYSMVLAGLVWTYIVSSHTHKITGQASFLQKSDMLPIHVVSETVEQFSARIGAMLQDHT